MRRGAGARCERGWCIAVAGTLIAAAVLVGLGLPLRPTTAQLPRDARTLRTPGLPPVYRVAFTGGRSLGVYLDPGRAGPNQLHGTFLDAEGGELELAWAPVVTATGPAGRPTVMAVLQEGPGHFYSDGDFPPGACILEIVATTRAAETLRAHLAIRF